MKQIRSMEDTIKQSKTWSTKFLINYVDNCKQIGEAKYDINLLENAYKHI